MNGRNLILIQGLEALRDSGLGAKIAALEDTAWPGSGEEPFPGAPGTYAASLAVLEDGMAVCHVGVRKAPLLHRGRQYLACGLSEVVTHPARRGRGLTSGLIKRAGEFIAGQGADISIFTYAGALVPFYTRGGWETVRGACFVGGTDEKPFRSDSLDLVTMMRFFSPSGTLHRADFEGTDIVFALGEGQLW